MEFIAGRSAAERALSQMSSTHNIDAVDQDQIPIWPSGCVGSIAHSAGVAVAIAARCDIYDGLGIDIEDGTPLDLELGQILLTREEVERCNHLDASGFGNFLKLAFVAKEAFYKAFYPLRREHLEFTDVDLMVLGNSKFLVSPSKERSNLKLPALGRGIFNMTADFTFGMYGFAA